MSTDTAAQLSASVASSSAFVRRMVASVALINLFVFGMVVFSLYQSYGEYEERAEMTAKDQAQMLGQDIAREFEKIDVALLAAADEIEQQMAHGGIKPRELNAYLGRLQARIPEIISLRVINVAGVVSFGLGVDPKNRPNNSDREYFTRQRDNPQAGLVIAKPVMARIDKQWIIPVSRPVRRADGSFAGVVYANVALEHLVKVFSSLDVGLRGTVSLRDSDLRIFAHYPLRGDVEKVLGQRLEMPELQALIDTGQDAGTYVSSHTVDGIERKFAVRRVDDLHLYAVVGRASDEYMTPWRAQASKILALELLFLLTTLIASWLIYRSWMQQRAATMELAREEEKFHTVADYTYDWEYWEGSGHELLFISPSCERVTGYSRAEFLADTNLLYSIIHPDDKHLMNAHQSDVMHEDESTLDFRIMRKDGGIRWIAHGCRSVFGHDGKFMGRRVSNRDITERKEAEAALFKLNAELEQRVAQRTTELETAIYDLESFNYSASHDLRIPLRAVDGFSKILLDEYSDKLDAEGLRLLHVVRNNTQRLAQYLDGMLTFSRTGHMTIKLEEIDMDELVREVLQELNPSGAGRELKLVIYSLPPVIADRDMMRRVVFNLLANSIKFTRDKPVAQIEVGAQIQDNETVYFVRDNGAGFDIQYSDKLFGVFQRLHGPAEFEGAGIGLSIVKRIISRHGGRVWAEGKVNAGATFYFSIPKLKEAA